MEKNSGALECLILFYINMKHKLKTKQLDEDTFINQMIKYCKERGFNKHSNEVIKNVWMKLVSKYLSFKSHGTMLDKESWKYFEIFDSCYEESDFSDAKFTEHMTWLMIECFWKRKCSQTAPRSYENVIAEVHKDFLRHGYMHVSKQLIKNEWRRLNRKYDEFKTDPEMLRKTPYLQAIEAMRRSGKNTLTIEFTKDLTEKLIEYFTDLKIHCIIHGYDSEKVLSEIQSKFENLGFKFSKENIKEHWRKLVNVYKFICTKGKSETTWIYFDAMKNHFKDDFSHATNKPNYEAVIQQSDNKRRCLRPRSKSVGAELFKKNLIVELSPEKITENKNKSAKRCFENHRQSNHKKFKLEDTIVEKDVCEITENSVDKSNITNQAEMPLDDSSVAHEERKVHITNIGDSDIDHKSGNLTNSIPSITKQFSHNEFLPLKKRLRVNDADNNLNPSIITEVSTAVQSTDEEMTKKYQIQDTDVAVENEAKTIPTTDNEESVSVQAEDILNSGESIDQISEELNENFSMTTKITEVGHPEELSVQKYVSHNSIQQKPVVLLFIKVDGNMSNNKEHVIAGNNQLTEIANISDTKKINDGMLGKQELCVLPLACDNFIKPASPKRKAASIKRKSSSRRKKNTDPSEIVPYSTELSPQLISTENEPIGNNSVQNYTEYSMQNNSFVTGIEDNVSGFKPEYNMNTRSELDTPKEFVGPNATPKRSLPGFKFVSHVIKEASTESVPTTPSGSRTGLKSFGSQNFSYNTCGRSEDFDNESVFSEAVGEDDGLKDNLLATVIDFQEQNNHEFIEIKNLMKQNNLLQRETNRLLRLLIEQM